MAKAFFRALGNLFRAPATSAFPAAPTYKPQNYRGLIVYGKEACIFCKRCEKMCPAGAIVFEQTGEGKSDFTYHYSSNACVFCGECVRACPKASEGALSQSAEPSGSLTYETDPNQNWNLILKKSRESQTYWEGEKKKKAAEKIAAEKKTAE